MLRGGRAVSAVDLPGTCGLIPGTPDEQVTVEATKGRRTGQDMPVAVVDATHLRMNLRLVLERAAAFVTVRITLWLGG